MVAFTLLSTLVSRSMGGERLRSCEARSPGFVQDSVLPFRPRRRLTLQKTECSLSRDCGSQMELAWL